MLYLMLILIVYSDFYWFVVVWLVDDFEIGFVLILGMLKML